VGKSAVAPRRERGRAIVRASGKTAPVARWSGFLRAFATPSVARAARALPGWMEGS
jgi:hypothetical protein